MAAKSFVLAELETVLRGVVAGDRNYRLGAMNAFRVANNEDAVDYLVNADTVTRADFDTALTNFTGDVSNAAAGGVTGDTVELETIFTYLLTAGRVDRLKVLNVVREEIQEDSSVSYLVNMHVPLPGEAAAALAAVAEDADA